MARQIESQLAPTPCWSRRARGRLSSTANLQNPSGHDGNRIEGQGLPSGCCNEYSQRGFGSRQMLWESSHELHLESYVRASATAPLLPFHECNDADDDQQDEKRRWLRVEII